MVMENSSEIFEVTSVHQPQIVSNPMMKGFIQRTKKDKPTQKRKVEKIKQKPKKKRKAATTLNLASFFK